jgi:hypothetical protein
MLVTPAPAPGAADGQPLGGDGVRVMDVEEGVHGDRGPFELERCCD